MESYRPSHLLPVTYAKLVLLTLTSLLGPSAGILRADLAGIKEHHE